MTGLLLLGIATKAFGAPAEIPGEPLVPRTEGSGFCDGEGEVP